MKNVVFSVGAVLGAVSVICLVNASITAAQQGWQNPTAKNFPLAGGNLANQRHSALTQINPSNVSKLAAHG